MTLYTTSPGDERDPPFGSKRAAALALYKPPFKFLHGYIHDADGRMMADQGGFDGKVEEHIIARVRGWGRIGYLPDAEALQDEVGAVIAEALTAFWLSSSTVQQVGAEWMPIESAPRLHGQRVLLLRDGGNGPFHAIGYALDGVAGWGSNECRGMQTLEELGYRVTHWMPLPTPPKSEQGDQQ